MRQLLYFMISLFSSTVGGICGVGGGIVIKPMLDALGNMSVSSISFLSGCTVLSMSVVSVLRNRKARGLLEFGTSTPLALGAVVGGILGKYAFECIKSVFRNENRLGAIQAGFLFSVLLVALLYAVFENYIHTFAVKNIVCCCAIGMVLGSISAFLGIGGGPINLSVLGFFFSMNTKKAAANSLYIIMFSQLSSLFQTFFSHSVPTVEIFILILMIIGAILGGFIGNRIQRTISARSISRLFVIFTLVVMVLDLRNLICFIQAY